MTSKVYSQVSREIRAGMVDMETGELLEGMPILDRKQAKHYWETVFVVAFQESLKAIVPKLSGEEARMLLHILASLGMNNEWMVLNQRDTAKNVGMARSQVSRAMKSLSEKNIIVKGTRIGKGHAYSLNPNLGWRGPFKNHAPAKRKAPHLSLVHSREELCDPIAA